jgi:hypothetical protein
MEAHPCGGESDAQIAAGAWDFRRINEAYSQYLEILKRRPNVQIRGELAALPYACQQLTGFEL